VRAVGWFFRVLVIALLPGCGSHQTSVTPAAPSQLQLPEALLSTFTVSGTVFEHTSTGPPLAGLHFSVGYPNAPQVDVASDGDGRYKATGLPSGKSVFLTLPLGQGTAHPVRSQSYA
jgi:hypothetical protein